MFAARFNNILVFFNTFNSFIGDIRNAGTSAKVFIELFGQDERFPSDELSSGRIMLNDGRFERGMIDSLHVESPKMITPVSRVLIGHDNSGAGPGKSN